MLTKNNYDKITTRLALILTKLNSGERFTIKELADEFNTSTRTIQRDLNERFQYLPIKKDGNYYYLEEYCLGKLNFEDIRNFSILSGISKLYPKLSDEFIVDLLNSKINSIIVRGHKYENITSKQSDFDDLNLAIVKHKKIKFDYNNKSRVINPYKLLNQNGIWYLSADDNGTLKTFSFIKISKLEILDEVFDPNDEFKKIIAENRANWFSQTIIEVKLKLDNKAKEYFLRRELLPHQQILEDNEDNLIISTKVSYDEEILKVVRYWIPHIKIISPSYLQDKLEDELKKYLDN